MLARTKTHLYLPAAVLVLSALVLALLPTMAEAKETSATSDVRGAERVVVSPGDSLWSISSDLLGPNASPREIAEETERIYALNRDLIGGDPNLIFAHQELSLPPEADQPAAGPTARVAQDEAGAARTASASRASQGGIAGPAGEGGEASQARADLLALPDVAAPVPAVRPLASPDAARSPAASLWSVWSDVRSTYSSAVTALDNYSLAELRANLDRLQLGIGIIALTFLVAGVMAWKAPMKRNIGDAAAWGIPSGHFGSHDYPKPLDSYGHVTQAPAEAPGSREDALKNPVTSFVPKQDTGGADSGVATAENRLAGAGVIGALAGRRKHTRRRKRPSRSRHPRGGATSGAYSREIRRALSQATLKIQSPRSARRRARKTGRGTLAMKALPSGHLGGAWLAPELSEPSAEPSVTGESISDPRLLLLSARQWETLELAAEGLPNAQIARRLFITESTVKQHLRKAYRTLGIRNRREAAALFGRDGQAGSHSAQEEV